MLYYVELIPRNLANDQGAGFSRATESNFSAEGSEAASFFGPGTLLESRRLYLLQFDLAISPEQAQRATWQTAQNLLCDPVAQTFRAGALTGLARQLSEEQFSGLIMTAYRPGVTDAEGESTRRGYGVMTAALDQPLPALLKVRGATLWLLQTEQTPPPAQLAQFAARRLNPLVQDFVIFPKNELNSTELEHFVENQFRQEQTGSGTARTIELAQANPAELEQISKTGLLALNLEEMQAIQVYYRQAGRNPSDIELETLAQTWSEHCVHKTFKAIIEYSESDGQGNILVQREIDGLFKSYIAEPTHQLKKGWIVSAFVDNAGVISFDQDYDVSFKVETHNHPSALEPFGGANTGLGGVIRDVMAVSAKPIAATDVFCLGRADTPAEFVPEGVLDPARVLRGVVDGVRDYGNKMGIPTVNGALIFDRSYVTNPLVFCGTVGIAPHGSHPRQPKKGDRIVVIGGRTGRDGIHGATFSSIELGGEASQSAELKTATVVQIGNPIEEKKTLDLLLKARDRQLYNALTDCGAGGLSSAVGEMGAELGAQVELARVPLKYAGLEPWEIWVSEAQERMVLAISPQKWPEFLALCQIEDVEATDLGEFTDDGKLTLLYDGQVVGQLDMEFLHHGLPRRRMQARWQTPPPRPIYQRAHYEHHRPYQGYSLILKRILADPTIASKESVIRLYDHEVQGGTVVKPLVGVQNDGPGDAAIIKPLPHSNRGLVISNGINPRYSLLDPYHMAMNSLDEAVRNAIAVGGSLERMALLDNFCWGNPNNPERLGELTRAALACRDYALALGLPFISGKDSLNNEYRNPQTGESSAVLGTLLISALSVIEDVTKAVTMDLKREGNLLFIVGRTRAELGAGYYAKYHGQFEGEVPKVDTGAARRNFRAVSKAIKAGLVRSCHDLSEGGLAVAAAEMAFAGGLGLRYDLTHVPYAGRKDDRTNSALLFSETPSRFLLEIEPERRTEFETVMQDCVCEQIGLVLGDDEYTVLGLSTATVLRIRASELKEAWQTGLG